MTGVTASVNLSTERAYISALAPVPAQDLVGVIRAAGYTAELARPAAQAGLVRARWCLWCDRV